MGALTAAKLEDVSAHAFFIYSLAVSPWDVYFSHLDDAFRKLGGKNATSQKGAPHWKPSLVWSRTHLSLGSHANLCLCLFVVILRYCHLFHFIIWMFLQLALRSQDQVYLPFNSHPNKCLAHYIQMFINVLNK